MTPWSTAAIGDVAEIVSGATPKTGDAAYWDGGVPWATPRDLSCLEGPTIALTERTLTSAGLASCAASLLPAGSVLLSSRAPIGHVAINTVPMATNQGFKSLVPHRGLLEAKYAYHWLRANTAYLESLGNGATFKELSKATLSRVSIPLPPMEEQRRIAAILDQVDALRTKRRGAITQLDTLTQSNFVAMFGGAGHVSRPLRDLTREFRYGTSVKSGDTGAPTLRIPNVIAGSVDVSDIKTVAVHESERARLRLVDGDLLFVRTNGNPDNVGRSAVYSGSAFAGTRHEGADVIYASYLIRARLDSSKVLPRFAQANLSGASGRRAMRSVAKTSAGQYNVNIDGLGSVPIPIPPLDEQQAFVNMVESTEGLRHRFATQLRTLDALFASLQDRVFEGVL